MLFSYRTKILASALIGVFVASQVMAADSQRPEGVYLLDDGKSPNTADKVAVRLLCDSNAPKDDAASKCRPRIVMLEIHMAEGSSKRELTRANGRKRFKEWTESMSNATQESCDGFLSADVFLIREELSKVARQMLSNLEAACKVTDPTERAKALRIASPSTYGRWFDVMSEVDIAVARLSNASCTLLLESEESSIDLVRNQNGTWTSTQRLSRPDHCDRIESNEFNYDGKTQRWSWVKRNDAADNTPGCTRSAKSIVELYRSTPTNGLLLARGCRLLNIR